MASEHSMDIVVDFDFQELRNAIDQAKKESVTRYDLKDAKIEIELTDESIKINAQSDNQLDTVFGMIIQKAVNRKLSPKILVRGKKEEAGGMRMREEIKLIKALDQENAKELSKIIRDNFPKAKPTIQGEALRVSAKDIDDLQAIMAHLRKLENIKVPLNFTNYR